MLQQLQLAPAISGFTSLLAFAGVVATPACSTEGSPPPGSGDEPQAEIPITSAIAEIAMGQPKLVTFFMKCTFCQWVVLCGLVRP